MANKQMNIGNSTSNVDVNITGNLNVNNSDAITSSVLDKEYRINYYSEDGILKIGNSSLSNLSLEGRCVDITNTGTDTLTIQSTGGNIGIMADTRSNSNIKLSANQLDLSGCNKTVFDNSGPYGISFNLGDNILHIGDLSLDNGGWTCIDNDCRCLNDLSFTYDKGATFYPWALSDCFETSPTATSGIVSSTTSNNCYYIKFANGIMIQGVASRYVKGNKIITWPVSFVNAEYVVTVGTTAGNVMIGYLPNYHIADITKTSIRINQCGAGNIHYQEANKYITAIAIGRWR